MELSITGRELYIYNRNIFIVILYYMLNVNYILIFSSLLLIISIVIYLYKYIKGKLLKYPSDYIEKCYKIFDHEHLYEFDNLLSDTECDEIIKLSKPILEKSGVLNKSGYDKSRTSYNTFLDNNYEISNKLNKLIYDKIKIPIENYEQLQVVRYKPDQKYDAHYDACIDNENQKCNEDIKRFGSYRYATFIIYLNDDFDEGETEFPYKFKKIKPKKGKGVLFFNLNDTFDDVRYNSFHAGLPPKNGDKWMCNKWIRLKNINKNELL